MSKKSHKLVFFSIMLIWVSMLVVNTNSFCSSQKTYPLLYGDAIDRYEMKDMTVFSDASIAFVGSSNTSQTNGEGFIFYVDRSGYERFKKIYQSGNANGDTFNKVDHSSNNIFAVGTTGASGSFEYFGLKIFRNGGILNNFKIGTDTSVVSRDSTIAHMYAASSDRFYTVFTTKTNGNQIVSLSDTQSSQYETLFGLTSQTSSIIIRVLPLGIFQNNLLMIRNNKLYCFLHDDTNPTQNKGYELDTVTLSSSLGLQASDANGVGGRRLWVVATDGSTKIYGYHIDNTGSLAIISETTTQFTYVASDTVVNLDVEYVDKYNLFVYASLGTVGSVIKMSFFRC